MPQLVDPTHGALPQPERANGCFETMRAYRRRIFRLDDHLDRLYASAAYLGTRAPRNRRRLRQRLIDALIASGVQEAVVRVALIPRTQDEAVPHIVVQPVVLPTPAAYRRGIRVAVVPAQSHAIGAVSPQAKYSARLGSVLAILDAQLRGADEALFLDASGYVTESTASNFSLIKRGIIYTSPCWLGLLFGITREVLREVAGSLAIELREVPLTRHDLYTADEAFMSSTIKEVLPVTVVDGRAIGDGTPGPLTRRLARAFRHVVRRELGIR